MQNGTSMKEVKAGAGLGLGAVLLPVLWILGKVTGSVLRVFLWGSGIAFIMGVGAYVATRADEE